MSTPPVLPGPNPTDETIGVALRALAEAGRIARMVDATAVLSYAAAHNYPLTDADRRLLKASRTYRAALTPPAAPEKPRGKKTVPKQLGPAPAS